MQPNGGRWWQATGLGLILLTGAGLVAWAEQNDSGQNQCYDGHDMVACTEATSGDQAPHPRQDGRYGRDAQGERLTKTGGGLAGFDFTPLDAQGQPIPLLEGVPDTPPACTRDNLTGLTWEIKTQDRGLRDQDWTYAEQQAPGDPCGASLGAQGCDPAAYGAAVNAQGLCGAQDWRLPSVTELRSLVDAGGFDPALDAAYFPHSPSGPYRTATPGPSPGQRWVVHFRDGQATPAPNDQPQHLRLVRGPGAPPSSHAASGDGTISQTPSGLLWAPCSEGQSLPGCLGQARPMTWAEALLTARGAQLAGYGDWRLPSRVELATLVDRDRQGPAIDGAHFPNTPPAPYWTSTSLMADPSQAWSIDFQDGADQAQDKQSLGYLRLVRAGTVDGLAMTDTQDPTGDVPSAPTVRTGSASVVTAANAWITGTVDDRGSVTQVRFDYGPTDRYGATITANPTSLGAGSGATAVNATLSGLSCGTLYHYRVKAENAAGTSTGEDQRFTTAACVSDGIGLTAKAQAETPVARDAAGCGVNWQWVNPLPQGNDLYSVVYGNGLFVAVGNGDTILTSLDGVTWTLRTLGTNEYLRGVTWSGSQFVAVGTSGTILTSPDGVTWTSRTSGTTSQINGVTWSGSQFVAVGVYGTILTSPDGVSWTPRTSGTSNYLFGVTWSGSQFVAVGWYGTILTSPDGVTWTERTSGTTNYLEGVTWSGSRFVAVGGNGTILTSPDGVTWTGRTSGTNEWLNGVTWSGSQFVAVGSGTILTSPDGVSWTPRTSGSTDNLRGVTWNGNQFVAVGESGTILTSPNGVTWTVRTSGTTNGLSSVTWSGSQFVSVGMSGTILTSPNGVTWTLRTSGTTKYLYGVTWSGSQFVAVGDSGTILTSPDGVTWAGRTSGTSNWLTGVTWSGSQFVAVGGTGTILTSPDGVSWTGRTSGTTNWLLGVTWSGSQFVAVGSGGTILTSPNGVTWTLRTSGTARDINGVTWSGSQFVAVGGTGKILTSPDGVAWTLRTSGTTSDLYGVTWSGSQFVAVAILTSPNGVTWTFRTSGNANNLYGVTWSGTQFVAVGLGGTILTSICPAPPTVTTSAVSTITATGATLNGTVNANGADAITSFDYGPTISYGSNVAATPGSIGGRVGNMAIAANLTGLTCNTTYHYRVTATNSIGTSQGLDETFTTGACAPTATTSAASTITATGATLNGTVNANGADATASFDYGPTISYGSNLAATPATVGVAEGSTAISASLTGLTCNSTYHYRARGLNSAGTGLGGDQTFTTGACTPTATTSAASTITATGATLNGTVNANGADATASFDYGPTISYGSNLAATPATVGAAAGSTAISASLTGLTCNSTYHYQARGLNSAGTGLGGDQTFTTGACAPTATTSTASAIAANGATLNGALVPNGASTTATFEYGPTTSYGSNLAATPGAIDGNAGSTAISANLTGLTCNTTYHYRAKAVNSAGTGMGGDQTFTTGICVPTATTHVATIVTATAATLNGALVPNGTNTTATFVYGLTTSYGSSIAATPGTISGTAGSTTISASLNGLTCSTTYHYRAMGVNSVGISQGTDQSFTTAACGSSSVTGVTISTSPPAPQAVGTAIEVTAQASGGSGSYEYQFFFAGPSTNYTWTPMQGYAGLSIWIWTPTEAMVGENYLMVYARNLGSEAEYEQYQFIAFQVNPVGIYAPTVITQAGSSVAATSATLNGTLYPNGADTTASFDYGLTTSYGSNLAATPVTIDGSAGSTAISANLTELTCNTTYHYRAKGVNSVGTSYGGDQTFTTGACAPTAATSAASTITATGATLNGTVNANGADATVSFDYGPTISYGSNLAATPATVGAAAGGTAISAGLTGLSCNSTYHYRAKGVNSAGTGLGGDQTFTTGACPVTPPTAITGGASGITATGATLNGTLNANGANAAATFEYGPTTGYGASVAAIPATVGASEGTTVLSVSLTGLTCNSTYHYRVKATNNAGTGNGDDQSFTTSACPATAPTAITDAASAVTATGATLNGTVNANGADATVSFDYGPTISYGNSIGATPETVGASGGDTGVSASLSGLTCNSTYHYRVTASNSAGTSQGLGKSFTTAACPATAPTATTSAATDVTATAATLNGAITPNGATTTASFDYGPTTSYGNSLDATPGSIGGTDGSTAVSASLTGLTCNTTYHYQVMGLNSAGTGLGGDQSFTTGACSSTCTPGAILMNTPTTLSGLYSLASAQSITTSASVQVQTGADVTFAAPRIQLGPGFRVALGAKFRGEARTVTCP